MSRALLILRKACFGMLVAMSCVVVLRPTIAECGGGFVEGPPEWVLDRSFGSAWQRGVVRATIRELATGRVLQLPVSTCTWIVGQRWQGNALVTRYADQVTVEVAFTGSGDVVPYWTSTLSRSEVDSSISVRNTVTQYYDKVTLGNVEYVKVDKYTTSWEQFDGQVVVKEAVLRAGANGPTLDGGFTSDVVETWFSYPAFGETYTLYVPSNWGYVEINDQLLFFQGGRCISTLRRTVTGTEWELDVEVIQGSTNWSP